MPLEKSKLVRNVLADVDSVKGIKVLIVDDNKTNQEILKLQLLSREIDAQCADGADQALSVMLQAVQDNAPFQLVILDMHMPKVNGLQLAAQIHSHPDLNNTRMMILTSANNTATRKERWSVGISRCISKPVRQDELIEMVCDVMRTDLHAPQSLQVAIEKNIKRPDTRPFMEGSILLAEDNPVNQEVAKVILEKLGFKVTIASDGKQAIDLAFTHHYDAILMDCQMPVMDGYAATSAIRERLEAIPIIALTANASEIERQHCLDAGMDDFLSKPYSIDQLTQKISLWLPKEKGSVLTQYKKEKAGTEESQHVIVPVLNPMRLKQIQELDSGTENALLHKILRAFLESADTYTQQIESAIQDSNAEKLRQSSHALKSISGNIGAENLSGICEQLEQLGKTANFDQVRVLQQTMWQQYQQVIDEVNKILES